MKDFPLASHAVQSYSLTEIKYEFGNSYEIELSCLEMFNP